MENKNVMSFLVLGIIGILGLSLVSAYGMGFGFAKADLTKEEITEIKLQRQEMQTAIENNDYATWEALMQERIARFEDSINEETFEMIRERHQDKEEFHKAVEELKESGDFSKQAMQELKQEYGMQGQGFGNGFGKGLKHQGDLGNCPYRN